MTNVSTKDTATGTTTTLATYSNFNSLGQPTTETDPNNNQFNYSYDDAGRITKQSLSSSDTNTAVSKVIVYDDANSLVTIFYGNTTNGWQAGRISYDPLFGKVNQLMRLPSLLTVTTDSSSALLNALGSSPNWQISKTNTYDSDGRLATEATNLGYTTSHQYDGLNREILTTFPDKTTTTYNWDDLSETITDANNNSKVQQYDLLDRLVVVTESSDTNVTDITLSEILSPQSTIYTTFYTYDSASNLIQTTNPLQVNTTNTYDNLGRLILTDYPQDGANPMVSEYYSYDAVGNLKTKKQGSNSKTINYQFFDSYRINQVTIQPDNKVINYSYDNNSNIQTFSWNEGLNVLFIQLSDSNGNSSYYLEPGP